MLVPPTRNLVRPEQPSHKLAISTPIGITSSSSDTHATMEGYLKDQSLFETRGFVNGSWTGATDGATFPVYEPATGQVLANCASFSQDAFVSSIECCHAGYAAFWTGTTAKARAAILKKWNDLILENIDDCMSLA